MRLNLEITPGLHERLQTLQKVSGMASISEVVRFSLALYEHLLADVKAGAQVQLKHADTGVETLRLVLPGVGITEEPQAEEPPDEESPSVRKPYDPSVGDNRVCDCGHTYVRHFDPCEGMKPVGCKYCPCGEYSPRELPKINIRCETKGAMIKDGVQIAGSTYLNVLRVEEEDDGSLTVVTNHWPRPRGPVNMLESLKYWHDTSECVCNSRQAIGACLKCDMQAALDTLGGSVSAEYPPEREEIFLVSQTCQGGKWNKLVKSQEHFWYSAEEAGKWLGEQEPWMKEANAVFRVVIDIVEVEKA